MKTNFTRKSFVVITLVFAIACIAGCKQESEPAPQQQTQNPPNPWSIPTDNLISPIGVDAIPAITDPRFTSAIAADDFLSDEELVIGIRSNGVVRAYPLQIMVYHEIVNDKLLGNPVAITYCPFSGTSIAWSRVINGDELEFGISGLLYNSNLIPYDRTTNSRYSQMLMKSVNGELIDEDLETYTTIETSWKQWKSLFPETAVLSQNTGYTRNYGTYPFMVNGNDYRTDPFLLYPVSNGDTRLSNKERVLGVLVDDHAKVYRFSSFAEPGVNIIEDSFLNIDLVLAGSADAQFMVAFERRLPDGTSLTFTPVQNEGSVVMQDQDGNKWDVLGECVEGTRAGQQLNHPKSLMGYWFSFPAFFPNPEIY